MPRYLVELVEIVEQIYEVEVSAENPQQAKLLAEDTVVNDSDPDPKIQQLSLRANILKSTE